MHNQSKLLYIIIFTILLTIAIPTIIYTYLGIHPLRTWYFLLFKIGLIIGGVRSIILIKAHQIRSTRGIFRKYGFFILFIITYFATKIAIRTFENYELTHKDTLIVTAFFILGLLLTNYGLFSYYLWKKK